MNATQLEEYTASISQFDTQTIHWTIEHLSGTRNTN